MNQGKRALRFLFYGLWALLMTGLTYVMGGVSLKVMRRDWGSLWYWTVTLGMSASLYAFSLKALGLAFLSLTTLIGIFSELEERGFDVKISGFITLLVNSILAYLAFTVWIYSAGAKWKQQIVGAIEAVLKPLVQINPKLQINYQDLMIQLPSVILILWIMAIYLAVRLEGRISAVEKTGSLKSQLAELRMPDLVVWLFIAALLGAFGGLGIGFVEAISVNVLNVGFTLFFLQGIAVVGRFFDFVRMSGFWQFVFMVLLVVHLFLFVSLLGLVDYWADFRARLEKRGKEQMNRGI